MLGVMKSRSYASNTAFSDTVNTNTGIANGSARIITPAILFRGSQVRATFKAGPSGSLIVNNVGIGKSAGSGATTTTPVELKFSGSSGFSLSASVTTTSDWTQLPAFVTTADSLVAIIDAGASGNIGANTSSTCATYFASANASYLTAAPAGFTLNASNNWGLQSVEVRL